MPIGSGSHLSQIGGRDLGALFEVLADPSAYQEKWQALEKHAADCEARFHAAAQGIADLEAAKAARERAEKAREEAEDLLYEAEQKKRRVEEELERKQASHSANVARWERNLEEKKQALAAREKEIETKLSEAKVARDQATALLNHADQRDQQTRVEKEKVEAKIRAFQEAGQ